MRYIMLVLCCLLCVGCQAALLWQNSDTAPAEEQTLRCDIVVHLVTNRAQLPMQVSNVRGAWWHRADQDIWILATKGYDGQWYPDQTVLGHEVQHVLHSLNPQIADPDIVQVVIQK